MRFVACCAARTKAALATAAVFLAVCGGLPRTVVAAPFPSELRNTTISVSIGVRTVGRRDDGIVTPIIGTVRQSVYVSSLGRAFVRETLSTIHAQSNEDVAVRQGAATQFSGNTLKLPITLVRGTGAATVTFDPSFKSCSVTAAVSGNAVVFRGATGRTYQAIQPIAFSNLSCSVRSGNALAN